MHTFSRSSARLDRVDPGRPHIGCNGQLHEPIGSWQALGNGHRLYTPNLMRFHRPDAWSPFERGGIHAYAYAGADPINHADPDGRWALPMAAIVMFAGALAVGGGAVASSASGHDRVADALGAIAGVLTLGAIAAGTQALVARYGVKPGQMQVHKGTRKDVVVAHGAPHGTMAENADLDGTALASALQSRGVGNKPVRLISCHGADGPAAQGQVLANATQQRVTAYKGRVVYNPLVKRVLWGSPVTFHPQTGLAAEATAIRNRALNQEARQRAQARLLNQRS